MLHPPKAPKPASAPVGPESLDQEAEALRQLMGESAVPARETVSEPDHVRGNLHYEDQIVQIALTALARPTDNVRRSMDPQDRLALQASLTQQGMMHPGIVEAAAQ